MTVLAGPFVICILGILPEKQHVFSVNRDKEMTPMTTVFIIGLVNLEHAKANYSPQRIENRRDLVPLVDGSCAHDFQDKLISLLHFNVRVFVI